MTRQKHRTCDSQVAGSSPGWAPLRSGFGQATYTCIPLSPSSKIWCQSTGVTFLAGTITAGLVESNGSIPPGLWLTSPAGWLPRRYLSILFCFHHIYWALYWQAGLLIVGPILWLLFDWLRFGLLTVAILCPDVPTANNIIASTDNRLFGTVVHYNCLLGYYVNPNTPEQYNSLSIECLETKVWNNTEDIPDCARKWHRYKPPL